MNLSSIHKRLLNLEAAYNILFKASMNQEEDEQDLASFFAGVTSALGHFSWWFQRPKKGRDTEEGLRRELRKERLVTIMSMEDNKHIQGYNMVYSQGYLSGVELLENLLPQSRQLVTHKGGAETAPIAYKHCKRNICLHI